MYILYQIGLEDFNDDEEKYNPHTGCVECRDVKQIRLWVKGTLESDGNREVLDYKYQNQIRSYLQQKYPDNNIYDIYMNVEKTQENIPLVFVLNVE